MAKLKAAFITTEELRSELPIPFVLHHYGYQPVEDTGDRLTYNNPWREDENASLDVFTNSDGVQRAGDFAIGFQGSVLDIIQAEATGDFESEMPWVALIAEARRLYTLYTEEGWDGPKLDKSRADLELDQAMVEMLKHFQSPARDWEGLDALLASRPGLQDLSWIELFEAWVNDGRLVLPYPDGQAYRLRYPSGDKMYVRGSTPGLYHCGVDLSDGKPILLVEGESDTWAATTNLGNEWNVVGIPGVGHQPSHHGAPLAGSRVVIAFDGDERGREGAERWATYLASIECDVEVVPMPDGSDISSLTHDEFRTALSRCRPLVSDVSGLIPTSTGFGIITNEGKGNEGYRTVCNWTIAPMRVLEVEDRIGAYEVEVQVGGRTLSRRYTINSDDLRSASALSKWAQQFGGGWIGNRDDHLRLQMYLAARSGLLPQDLGTYRPGLYGTSFTWPGGWLGNKVHTIEHPRYLMSRVNAFQLRPAQPGEDYSPVQTVRKLANSHELKVVSVFMAWFAMAPLRSLYNQFPSLFVTGRAGSGKTTLCELYVRYFAGVTQSLNLTSTTPYGLSLAMGSTNAFVTYFDEFRPGASVRTMTAMKQLIRDAYNATPSIRGGMSDNPGDLTEIHTDNPLLVSGEDMPDEQSHRDRLIKVFLPRRPSHDLPIFTSYDEVFAHDYLSWLLERYEGNDLSVVENPPDPWDHMQKYVHLSDRQAWNLAVLDCGWNLINNYMLDRGVRPSAIPEVNWDHLVERTNEENQEDPVLEAVRFVHESYGDCKAVFRSEGKLYVSTGQVLSILKKDRMDDSLPFSSSKAFSTYLVDNMDGVMVRRTPPGSVDGSRVRYVELQGGWRAGGSI